MAKFRRGTEAIEQAAEGKKRVGGFTPNITWKAGEEKYVQFLMPMEEVPTVLMHQFVIVGKRESGTDIFADFISRRDPALDGPQGYDELMDRFEVNPTQRSFVLAAVMEPVFEKGAGSRKKLSGFELAERQYEKEGEVHTVPDFGLIVQSPRTFFTHLAANADINPIEETIWLVKRTGGDQSTTYTFIPTGIEPLDLSEELEGFQETFDFDEYLEELSDEQRMRDLIGPLDDNAKVTRFPQKEKRQKREAPSTSQRSRRAPVEEVDEVEEVEAEEDNSSEARESRFQALRDKTKAKA